MAAMQQFPIAHKLYLSCLHIVSLILSKHLAEAHRHPLFPFASLSLFVGSHQHTKLHPFHAIAFCKKNKKPSTPLCASWFFFDGSGRRIPFFSYPLGQPEFWFFCPGQRLSDPYIGSERPLSRKYYLPQLKITAAKCPCTGQQVILPHTEKTLIITRFQTLPICHHIVMPSQ